MTDNAITYVNPTYINATSNFAGEVSGTYKALVVSDTALDDQYVLRENSSIVSANATTTNFKIIEWNSTCAGFRFGTTGGLILSCS